jgi:CheY-like chemotaxis protein
MATVALVACVAELEALLVEALRDAGHQTHALPLRGDTVSVLGKMKLDAVLVDGHPSTDLPAVLGALREQEATRTLPAVVVTARRRKDLAAFERVEMVEMPFDLNAFVAAIRRAVGDG